MPYQIICHSCSALIYSGFDLRYVREVLKPNAGKCKNCGAKLSQSDAVEVERVVK